MLSEIFSALPGRAGRPDGWASVPTLRLVSHSRAGGHAGRHPGICVRGLVAGHDWHVWIAALSAGAMIAYYRVWCAVGCSQGPVAPTPSVGATSDRITTTQHHAVPFSGVAIGEASFNTANPRGSAIGFTTISDAKGTASHLGATVLHSEHCVNEANEFTGSLVLTAANGDEMHGTYSGNATAPGQVGDEMR